MLTNRLFHLLIAGLFIMAVLLAACAPAASPAPTNPPVPTAMPDLKLAVVGSWTSTVTKEDILRVVPAFDKKYLCDNAGTFIWKINTDGTFTIDQTPLADCPAPANTHIEDVWTVEGNLITFAKGTPQQEIYEIAVTADRLTFIKAKSSDCVPCMAINTANPWKRVE